MKKIVYLILIPLLSVVTVQICLSYPMTREIFTDIEVYEGIRKDDSAKSHDAVMEIEIISGTPNKKTEVLYNSQFVTFLDAKRVSFYAPGDGIVQIKNLSGKSISVDVYYNPEKLRVKNIQKQMMQLI